MSRIRGVAMLLTSAGPSSRHRSPWFALIALSLAAGAASHAAEPPSVSKPTQRPSTPVQTAPPFVREPVVRPPGQISPELARLQRQLQELDKSLADLQQKRDGTSEMSQQQTQQMQLLMDRKAKLEQRVSDLLKQQSDSTQTITGNSK